MDNHEDKSRDITEKEKSILDEGNSVEEQDLFGENGSTDENPGENPPSLRETLSDEEIAEILNDEHITRIQYGEKELILIGTAHVSKQSADLVKAVIALEKPDSVCIELDEKRYENLQNPKAWQEMDVIKVVKSKKVGFMLVNLALSSYQKKMAKKLDSPVGGEMIQGIGSAEEQEAELVLADRDIQTTFLRIWRKLSFWRRSKLVVSLIISDDDDDEEEITEETLQELMQKDMLESVLADIHKDFPEIGEVLINERDQHLAAKIKAAPGNKIVAVLGGAHIPGVTEEINKEQDLSEITTVPPKSRTSKIVGWVIPLSIVGLLVYYFIINIQTGFQQLTSWVLFTGLFAAAFTLLALPHPLTVLTSFLVAPLTTLHPLLACGWFAGIVEALIRKPTVQDVQSISEDIFSLKGFFKNRFLKILIVVVLANIGASIGNLLAVSNLIRNLF